MNAPAADGPTISAVVTTTRPWPEIRDTLASLYAQTLAQGGEVIVADGSGLGLPPAHEFSELTYLPEPGATVFRLRSLGLRSARAPIVALTEDHCRVAPDWIACILHAHAEHPQAGMIGGAVLNGARERGIDWANFLVTNGPYLPPLDVREGPDVSGQANVSYKRRHLDRYPDDALHEGTFRRALARDSVPLVADERISVEHIQSLGIGETLMLHFHDGRCIAAAHQARSPAFRRLVTVGKGLLWPVRVPAATLRVLLRTFDTKPAYRRALLSSAPWLLPIVAFHKAGELVGALAGAGQSPDRMR